MGKKRSKIKPIKKPTVQPPTGQATAQSNPNTPGFIEKETEVLYRLTLFSPLVSAALLASMFRVKEFHFVPFASVICLIGGVTLIRIVTSQGRDSSSFRIKIVVLYIWQSLLALLLIFNYPSVGTVAVVVSILFAIHESLSISSPLKVILLSLVTSTLMSLLALLGVLTQNPQIFIWQIVVIGAVPSFLLGAATVSRYSSLLERCNWKFSVIGKDRSGNDVRRPGGITILFSFFMLLLPGVIVTLPSIGLLPVSFLIGLFPLFYSANLCAEFFEQKISKVEAWQRAIRLSAIMAGLMAVGGGLT